LWCNVSKARYESTSGLSLSRQNRQDFRPRLVVHFVLRSQLATFDAATFAGEDQRAYTHKAFAGYDATSSYRTDAIHLSEAVRLRLDDVEHLLAEGV